MFKSIFARNGRWMAALLVVVAIAAVASNIALPARAEEDNSEFCWKMFKISLARAVAAGVINPSGFYYFYKQGLAGYEWCLLYFTI